MSFWNWRRATAAAATSGANAIALAPDLAPIELYTLEQRIVGWIAAEGRRVTDLLNEQDELRLWRPSPSPLESTDRPISHAHPEPLDPAEGEWDTLAAKDVLLAMPPEWRASRQLRLHRRLRRVALAVGPFAVTGNLHLHPGVEVTHSLLHGPQHFLPLTEAYLLHQAEPPFEHVVSVVIVNTRHVTQLIPLVSLA